MGASFECAHLVYINFWRCSMIFDSLENAQLYYPLSEKIKEAFYFIKSTDWKNLKPGKYEYNENIYGNLQEYETKNPDEAEFEVHRDYYDIQYVISGEEIMGFGSLDDFKVTKDYNKEKDVAFGECPSSNVLVKEGNFTFFAPKDAHKPCLNVAGEVKNVKKVIVKINS